ncbi:PH domain-containing protein [Priestia aryabhattai]|uniref:PH domain-containing protein n=1 Tax=Priestia aryabhattai TaxID=412384 RepID=UPI003CEFBF60
MSYYRKKCRVKRRYSMILAQGEQIVKEYKWKRKLTIILTNKRLIIRDKKNRGWKEDYSIFLKEVVNTNMTKNTPGYAINIGLLGVLGFIAALLMGDVFAYAKYYGTAILLSYLIYKRSSFRLIVTFSSGKRKGVNVHCAHRKELLELLDLVDAKVAEVA